MMELNLKRLPIDSIKPYEKNVKMHDEGQVERIAESIRKFGWDQPIVVDKHHVVIKGHGRRLAAIKLGLKEVPVLVRDDLTPAQVRAARLADNRVALSGIDTEMLRSELADLDFDLSGIFDDKEIDFSLSDLGEMNPTAFIDDIDSAVRAQEAEQREKEDEIRGKRVALAKALGFKDIAGEHELYFTRFLAMAESKTGLQGEAALAQTFKKQLEAWQSE